MLLTELLGQWGGHDLSSPIQKLSLQDPTTIEGSCTWLEVGFSEGFLNPFLSADMRGSVEVTCTLLTAGTGDVLVEFHFELADFNLSETTG